MGFERRVGNLNHSDAAIFTSNRVSFGGYIDDLNAGVVFVHLPFGSDDVSWWHVDK
ncbi:MAG: hypothetical protein AB3N13_08775 [Arenibacterium sp.]